MHKVLYVVATLLLISAFSLAACGGGDSGSQPSTQDNDTSSEAESAQASGGAKTGEEKFATICAACHGPTAEGVQGLGKDLTTSEFVASKTDDELVAFIKVGREVGDPLNETGVAMPPNGGNPAFTDEDLHDIVSFIRTLQK